MREGQDGTGPCISPVREQIAPLETIDPATARTVCEAAESMYRPADPGEAHDRFPRAHRPGHWACTAVCERYAAYYAPSASGEAA